MPLFTPVTNALVEDLYKAGSISESYYKEYKRKTKRNEKIIVGLILAGCIIMSICIWRF